MKTELGIIERRWSVFLRVVSTGSFSKAAVALDMPQSMVSRSVAQLESECGERLFLRTGRGAALTDFGCELHLRIARLVADAEAVADDIRSNRGQVAGEVLVGLLPSAVGRLAGPLFADARRLLPKVRLHLMEGASAQLEERLREGRLDMAMCLREDESEVGDARVLARIPLHIVGRHGDELLARGEAALATLSGLPLVVPARPHPLRARLDRIVARQGLELRIAAEVDSVRLQQEVVAAGGGYAIASVMPGQLDARLASARIVDPVLERFVVLEESPRRVQTRAVRAIGQLIRELAQSLGDA